MQQLKIHIFGVLAIAVFAAAINGCFHDKHTKKPVVPPSIVPIEVKDFRMSPVFMFRDPDCNLSVTGKINVDFHYRLKITNPTQGNDAIRWDAIREEDYEGALDSRRNLRKFEKNYPYDPGVGTPFSNLFGDPSRTCYEVGLQYWSESWYDYKDLGNRNKEKFEFIEFPETPGEVEWGPRKYVLELHENKFTGVWFFDDSSEPVAGKNQEQSLCRAKNIVLAAIRVDIKDNASYHGWCVDWTNEINPRASYADCSHFGLRDECNDCAESHSHGVTLRLTEGQPPRGRSIVSTPLIAGETWDIVDDESGERWPTSGYELSIEQPQCGANRRWQSVYLTFIFKKD